MTRAICKFSVTAVKSLNNGEEEEIHLHTQYDENDPEDTKFSKYTPWGEMNFGLSNPNLIGKFKPGQVVRVTLEPLEEET